MQILRTYSRPSEPETPFPTKTPGGLCLLVLEKAGLQNLWMYKGLVQQ